jgi:hypothetical protein
VAAVDKAVEEVALVLIVVMAELEECLGAVAAHL